MALKLKLLPWWAIVFLFLFAHFFVERAFMSSCGVLGISSPAKKDVQKALRKLSLCTHPDRFRTAEDKHRADVLFKRVSWAIEDVDRTNRWAKQAKLPQSCWLEESEFLKEAMVFVYGSITEFPEVVAGIYERQDPSFNELVYVVLYALAVYFFVTKVLFNLPSILIGLVKRPLPTLLRFFQVPYLRLELFLRKKYAKYQQGQKQGQGSGSSGTPAAPTPARAKAYKAKERAIDEQKRAHVGLDGRKFGYESESDSDPDTPGHPGGGPAPVRRRKHNPAPEPPHGGNHAPAQAPHTAASNGVGGDAPAVDDDGAVPSGDPGEDHAEGEGEGEGEGEAPQPADGVIRSPKVDLFDNEDIRRTIQTRPESLLRKWRMIGTAIVQFEFFLHFTKNIVPMVMLVLLGEAHSGLLTSLLSGMVIRRFPRCSYELLHVFCFLLGFAHTYLGMGAAEMVRKSAVCAVLQSHGPPAPPRNGLEDRVLNLAWTWGFKDTVALTFLAMQGAVFAAVTGFGNEPHLTTSFTAGVAMRINAYERFPESLYGTLMGWLYAAFLSLEKLPFELVDEAESLTRSTAAVGGCWGGPFRTAFGEYSWAAVLFLRVTFLCLCVLYALQWVAKVHSGWVATGRKRVEGRVVAYRVLLFFIGTWFTKFVLLHNFDGITTGHSGLLFSGLLSMLLESLLSTYDIRGGVERLLAWVLFIFQ